MKASMASTACSVAATLPAREAIVVASRPIMVGVAV